MTSDPNKTPTRRCKATSWMVCYCVLEKYWPGMMAARAYAGPYDLYMTAAKLLLKGRSDGSITEEQDDDLADAMDRLWWDMSDEERSNANSALVQPDSVE